MPAPSIGNFLNLGFRLKFSIPSSGNFSNVRIKFLNTENFNCGDFNFSLTKEAKI